MLMDQIDREQLEMKVISVVYETKDMESHVGQRLMVLLIPHIDRNMKRQTGLVLRMGNLILLRHTNCMCLMTQQLCSQNYIP